MEKLGHIQIETHYPKPKMPYCTGDVAINRYDTPSINGAERAKRWMATLATSTVAAFGVSAVAADKAEGKVGVDASVEAAKANIGIGAGVEVPENSIALSPAAKLMTSEETMASQSIISARKGSSRNRRRAAICEYRALRKPKGIRGHYTWRGGNPEGRRETQLAYHYDISFRTRRVNKRGLNCKRYGNLTAEVRQDQYHKSTIGKPGWRWSERTSNRVRVGIDEAKKRRIKRTVRAPRLCWPEPYLPEAAKDKHRKAKGRPAVRLRWKDRSGEVAEKTYYGKTNLLC